MSFIYALKLETDKFFIGHTLNPIKSIEIHYRWHLNIEWLKKYPWVDIYELIPNCKFEELDKYTLKYMAKYGIDNVRGGNFINIILENNILNNIKQALVLLKDDILHNNIINKDKNYYESNIDIIKPNSIEKYDKNVEKNNIKIDNTKCRFCNKEFETVNGKNYHEKKYCKVKMQNNNIEIPNKIWLCKYCNNEFDTENGMNWHEKTYCPTKKKLRNCKFCEKEFDTENGARYHEEWYCKKKNIIDMPLHS